MADPFTIIIGVSAIAASANSLAVTISRLHKQFADFESEIQKLVQEVQVLCLVLEECRDTFQQQNELPLSTEQCMRMCMQRFHDLKLQIERIKPQDLKQRSKGFMHSCKLISKRMKAINTAPDRKAAFNSFRDAVLLLRDLASEFRMQKQLIEISTSFAQMIALHDDETEVDARSIDSNHHEPESTKVDPDRPHDKSTSKPHQNAGQVLAEMIRQNFTRNVTLIHDRGEGPGSSRFTYHPYRAKVDTGSDGNFVRLDVVQSMGIPPQSLVPIPEHERETLEGIENFRFVPEQSIELSWYQDGQAKMRKSTFYVIKEAPFDVLFGSKRMADELMKSRRTALIVAWGEGQSASELNAEEAAHQRHLEEEQIAEQAQLDARARRRFVRRRQRPPNNVQPQPVALSGITISRP